MPEIIALENADAHQISRLRRLLLVILEDRERAPDDSRLRQSLDLATQSLDLFSDYFYSHLTERLITLLEVIEGEPSSSTQSERLASRVNSALYEQLQNVPQDDMSKSGAKRSEMLSIITARAAELVANDRTIRAAERAEEAVAAARSVTGIQSLNEMQYQYLREVTRESRSADITRLAAILVLILAVGSAVLLLNRTPDNPYSAASHYSVTISLVLLSGYLARESAHHRFVSRELRFQQTQILSVLTFSDSFDDSRQRLAFLSEAGSNLFTMPFSQPGAGETKGLPVDQIEAIVQRFTELAKATRQAT